MVPPANPSPLCHNLLKPARDGRHAARGGRRTERGHRLFFPGASVRPVVLPLLPRLFNAGRDEAHNFPRNETVALKKNQLGVLKGFGEGFFLQRGSKLWRDSIVGEDQFRPLQLAIRPWNNFHQTYLKRAGLCFSWTLADSFNNST